MKESVPGPSDIPPEENIEAALPEPAESVELREPASYEAALSAARVLHDAGAESPDSEIVRDDPNLQKAWDTIIAWAYAEDGDERSAARAESMIREATIFIAAGYDTPENIREVLTYLRDEHARALTLGGNDEALAVFEAKLSELEERMVRTNPNEAIFAVIESQIKEIRGFLSAGRLPLAQGRIHSVLHTDIKFRNRDAKKNKNASPDLFTDEQRATLLRLEAEVDAAYRIYFREKFGRELKG